MSKSLRQAVRLYDEGQGSAHERNTGNAEDVPRFHAMSRPLNPPDDREHGCAAE
jgi:hypothetical protein